MFRIYLKHLMSCCRFTTSRWRHRFFQHKKHSGRWI